MRDVGAEIRRRRKALNWSILKLATLAGITASFLSRLETGKTYYSRETLMKIAGAMGVSADSFFISNSNVEDAAIGFRRIPILDYVQAGKWTGVDAHEGEEEEMRAYILTDLEHPPSAFAMKLRGDSMEPEFREGDVVVIAPTVQPRPGDYVVATDENGEATFKQYRNAGLNAAGVDVFELWPLNLLHAPMRSDRQKLAIVGTMLEHRRYRKRV